VSRRQVWVPLALVVMVAVAVVAFITESGTSTGGSSKERLSSWLASSDLSQDLGAIHNAGLGIDRALHGRNAAATLHTVCSVLSVTAEKANSTLPSPNTELNTMLSRAYTLEYEAGNNCYDAGPSGASLLAKSATERAEAQRIIDRAITYLQAITGKTVSTTTTTVITTGTEFL